MTSSKKNVPVDTRGDETPEDEVQTTAEREKLAAKEAREAEAAAADEAEDGA